jgi:hypothetical protein
MILDHGCIVLPGELCLDPDHVNGLDDTSLVIWLRRLSAIAQDPTFSEIVRGDPKTEFHSIEEFQECKRLLLAQKAEQQRIHEQADERRRQFHSRRRGLFRALIERDGYACAHTGCGVQKRLTIDHCIPLSKGGNNDLDNLRLLCRPHNSAKHNRL